MTMNRDIDVVNELIQKGVDILAPQSVYIAPEVDIDRIAPKTVIYPGTTITGENAGRSRKVHGADCRTRTFDIVRFPNRVVSTETSLRLALATLLRVVVEGCGNLF